ncbi:hypothetical protein LINPERHAP2_LOCUS16296 [Linum perenne]
MVGTVWILPGMEQPETFGIPRYPRPQPRSGVG